MYSNEESFETGMDEQAKQAGMTKLGEGVTTSNRDNDYIASHIEGLRHRQLQIETLEREHEYKVKSLELAEREQALTEKRNKAFNQDLADKQALEHSRFGFDKLNNLEPSEAVAQSNVLPSTTIEAIRAIVVETMKASK